MTMSPWKTVEKNKMKPRAKKSGKKNPYPNERIAQYAQQQLQLKTSMFRDTFKLFLSFQLQNESSNLYALPMQILVNQRILMKILRKSYSSDSQVYFTCQPENHLAPINSKLFPKSCYQGRLAGVTKNCLKELTKKSASVSYINSRSTVTKRRPPPNAGSRWHVKNYSLRTVFFLTTFNLTFNQYNSDVSSSKNRPHCKSQVFVILPHFFLYSFLVYFFQLSSHPTFDLLEPLMSSSRFCFFAFLLLHNSSRLKKQRSHFSFYLQVIHNILPEMFALSLYLLIFSALKVWNFSLIIITFTEAT